MLKPQIQVMKHYFRSSLVEYIKLHVIIFSLLICVITCMQFAQYFSALPEHCIVLLVYFVWFGLILHTLRYGTFAKQAKLILYSNDENDAMKQRANINHHVQNLSSYRFDVRISFFICYGINNNEKERRRKKRKKKVNRT